MPLPPVAGSDGSPDWDAVLQVFERFSRHMNEDVFGFEGDTKPMTLKHIYHAYQDKSMSGQWSTLASTGKIDPDNAQITIGLPDNKNGYPQLNIALSIRDAAAVQENGRTDHLRVLDSENEYNRAAINAAEGMRTIWTSKLGASPTTLQMWSRGLGALVCGMGSTDGKQDEFESASWIYSSVKEVYGVWLKASVPYLVYLGAIEDEIDDVDKLVPLLQDEALLEQTQAKMLEILNSLGTSRTTFFDDKTDDDVLAFARTKLIDPIVQTTVGYLQSCKRSGHGTDGKCDPPKSAEDTFTHGARPETFISSRNGPDGSPKIIVEFRGGYDVAVRNINELKSKR